MRISIFGMGYVGVVSAACLAKEGHTVIGVDPNGAKVDLVNSGMSPIVENQTPELIREAVAKGTLRATMDVKEAVLASELSLICVGTPSQNNGSLDLKYVRRVCEEIGQVLRTKDDFHVVVCRSTVLPGTMRGIVIPILEEHSGKQAGQGFGVCNNPEFLREGTAVHDFYNPPKTVIGETDPVSGDLVASLYAMLEAPLFRTQIEIGEMVKYVDNVWHALKVELRQRDRGHVPGAEDRQPRGHGDLLPGHEAQPVAVLPEAGLRVRRLVPAEGRPGPDVQGRA